MHRYFISTPAIVKKLYSGYVWNRSRTDGSVYLTFDDGPHPAITPWVLGLLKQFGAKASFFCIGDNVAKYPSVYRQIIEDGHAVGNHTYHHLNGWKSDDAAYVKDVADAAALINSPLFRPPYGRLRRRQAGPVKNVLPAGARIIMWDVLSADFDRSFTPEQCFRNVTGHVRPGSIIVFHDSEKAFPNLQFALPATLGYLKDAGFELKSLT